MDGDEIAAKHPFRRKPQIGIQKFLISLTKSRRGNATIFLLVSINVPFIFMAIFLVPNKYNTKVEIHPFFFLQSEPNLVYFIERYN